MGTSVLTVNDRHATFDDIDLLLVVRMLLSDLTDADRETLGALPQEWETAVETNAPGVVDLPVERYANDDTARPRLVSLLAGVESSLSSNGDVPLARLKGDLRVPGVMFERPYPSGRLLDASKRLRGLIDSGG